MLGFMCSWSSGIFSLPFPRRQWQFVVQVNLVMLTMSSMSFSNSMKNIVCSNFGYSCSSCDSGSVPTMESESADIENISSH